MEVKIGSGNGFMPRDDVIKWKHFPHYWPFVRVMHQSPVNSPHEGQWRRALIFSLISALNKRLSKQSWRWWFETPSRSLWRYCHGRVTSQCASQCWPRSPIQFHVSLTLSFRVKFFRGNINMYLHFMSLLHIDMTQVLKILPQVRPWHTYCT